MQQGQTGKAPEQRKRWEKPQLVEVTSEVENSFTGIATDATTPVLPTSS
ncbi:MAG: hypothetical protein AAFX04_14265 [Pseudomonadota bacterium]